MANKKRILIVDDESQITRVLRTALTGSGYEVRTAEDGHAGLRLAREWQPDLVITDVSMPNMTGIELSGQLRAESQVPIIVLSVKGEERTKVEALDAGADDYLTKPIGMDELLARVRRNLARVQLSEDDSKRKIEIGDFLIDSEIFRVVLKNREIRLTPKEFELLLYLARHAGRVVTHRALLFAIWGPNSLEQPEHLRVLVAQLRKKVETEGMPHYIVTEPWVGYRFEATGETES
ncbi:MAG TPA: response regulator transcription factor [Terriglobales bacterium]|jgi:two-component system KDP operon response regulator KdpE|nr:response regulator transcription factor [Terriglobales bacterium]